MKFFFVVTESYRQTGFGLHNSKCPWLFRVISGMMLSFSVGQSNCCTCKSFEVIYNKQREDCRALQLFILKRW